MSNKQLVITPQESKDVLSNEWKERLAKYAEEDKSFSEGAEGGLPFFSLKGNNIKLNDEKIKHNAMVVVILAKRRVNCYYKTKYSPDNVTPPACFAIGKDIEKMTPHENSGEKQSEFCKKSGGVTCPQYEWKSSLEEGSKARACSTTMRLALLPAGLFVPENEEGKTHDLFDKEEDFLDGEITYFKVPVTSTKNFEKFVERKNTMAPGLPLFAFYSIIQLVEDTSTARTPFRIVFKAYKPITSPEVLSVVEKYALQSEKDIDTPFDKEEETSVVDDKEEAKKRKF